MAHQFSQDEIDAFREVFHEFDRDGDQTIDTGELGAVFAELGQVVPQEMVEEMILTVDADGTGSIEFEEFLELMARKTIGELQDDIDVDDPDTLLDEPADAAALPASPDALAAAIEALPLAAAKHQLELLRDTFAAFALHDAGADAAAAAAAALPEAAGAATVPPADTPASSAAEAAKEGGAGQQQQGDGAAEFAAGFPPDDGAGGSQEGGGQQQQLQQAPPAQTPAEAAASAAAAGGAAPGAAGEQAQQASSSAEGFEGEAGAGGAGAAGAAGAGAGDGSAGAAGAGAEVSAEELVRVLVEHRLIDAESRAEAGRAAWDAQAVAEYADGVARRLERAVFEEEGFEEVHCDEGDVLVSTDDAHFTAADAQAMEEEVLGFCFKEEVNPARSVGAEAFTRHHARFPYASAPSRTVLPRLSDAALRENHGFLNLTLQALNDKCVASLAEVITRDAQRQSHADASLRCQPLIKHVEALKNHFTCRGAAVLLSALLTKGCAVAHLDLSHNSVGSRAAMVPGGAQATARLYKYLLTQHAADTVAPVLLAAASRAVAGTNPVPPANCGDTESDIDYPLMHYQAYLHGEGVGGGGGSDGGHDVSGGGGGGGGGSGVLGGDDDFNRSGGVGGGSGVCGSAAGSGGAARRGRRPPDGVPYASVYSNPQTLSIAAAAILQEGRGGGGGGGLGGFGGGGGGGGGGFGGSSGGGGCGPHNHAHHAAEGCPSCEAWGCGRGVGATLKQLVGGPAQLQHLKVLRLAHCKMGDLEVEPLAEGLAENGTLWELDLSYNDLGHKSAVALADMLTVNGDLRVFKVAWNRLTAAGVNHLLDKGLAANGTLEEVDLSWTGIQDAPPGSRCEGGGKLLGKLIGSAFLKKVKASHNNVGHEGALAVAAALRSNSNLVHLSLSHNPLGSAGVREMLKALRDNATLEGLDLSATASGRCVKGARAGEDVEEELAELNARRAAANAKKGSAVAAAGGGGDGLAPGDAAATWGAAETHRQNCLIVCPTCGVLARTTRLHDGIGALDHRLEGARAGDGASVAVEVRTAITRCQCLSCGAEQPLAACCATCGATFTDPMPAGFVASYAAYQEEGPGRYPSPPGPDRGFKPDDVPQTFHVVSQAKGRPGAGGGQAKASAGKKAAPKKGGKR